MVNETKYFNNSFGLWIMLLIIATFHGHFLQATINANEIDAIDTIDQVEEYVPGEVLVILADDPNIDINDIETMVEGTVQQKISSVAFRQGKQLRRNTRLNNRNILHVKLNSHKSVKQAIIENKNRKDPRILRIEPNYKIRILAVPNDPEFEEMWALRNTGQTGGTAYADIDAVSAWNVTTGSENVAVAVIDTGIDYTHPDLAENMWVNTGEILGNGLDDDDNGFIDDIHGYDFVGNDGNVMDEHSHGTHCAGTIAASGNNGIGVTGINWRCKLMACRFLNAKGSGNVFNAIKCINYAVANGADILSNSWGGSGYSEALADAITNAMDNGVLFVAAAGNDSANTDLAPHYPSCYPIANVISVAATDHDDALAYFSNYGKNSVHLGAPGVSILSSVLNQGYAKYSGTSMATPHVAGVAALLLANEPEMSVYELKSRLIWTGDEVDSLKDKTVTGRRLNAYNALTIHSALTVLSPNSHVTWVSGFDWTIQWTSISGSETVDIFLLKAGVAIEQLADNVSNTGSFTWHIPSDLAVGSDYKIWIDDGVNADESDIDFKISNTALDYFTELFSTNTGRFDLSNKSLLLTPDDSSSGYTACIKGISELPVNSNDSTNLHLDDDESKIVAITGNSVLFYGENYTSFYVNSNGSVTFGAADTSYEESISSHFQMKRISGLLRDFDPSAGGSVWTKQLEDRVVITWQNVPEYDTGNSNTFQIEMFYEGPIRLSWLSVDARYGLVGISEGMGTSPDFTQSDVSGYEQCLPVLESIEVTGPERIEEKSTAQLICTAHYDDGSTEDITSGKAVWSEDSDYAAVDETGRLITTDVNTYQQCVVTASYNGKSSSHTILVTDIAIDNLTIQKCTVKAGKIMGFDSIKCTGTINALIEQLESADNVNIRIYSGIDNAIIYEHTININSFAKSRNKNIYKYRMKSPQPGNTSYLNFDIDKKAFKIQFKNVDLTGLGSPLYILINFGSYCGLGIADEDVVNGIKNTIPLRLMNTYKNVLKADKVTLSGSTNSFVIKGGIAVEAINSTDLASEEVLLNWGNQIFTIPAGSFISPKSQKSYKCKKVETIEEGQITAQINLDKCKFRISVKNVNINTLPGLKEFGLTFSGFDEAVEINLK